jgi:hypothetical protein
MNADVASFDRKSVERLYVKWVVGRGVPCAEGFVGKGLREGS